MVGRRRRLAGLIGGLLGLAFLLVLIGFALQVRDLQTAANLVQLVSGGGAGNTVAADGAGVVVKAPSAAARTHYRYACRRAGSSRGRPVEGRGGTAVNAVPDTGAMAAQRTRRGHGPPTAPRRPAVRGWAFRDLRAGRQVQGAAQPAAGRSRRSRVGQDLRQDYPQFDGEALVESGVILPVMDGLDELPDATGVRVLARLNESIHHVGSLISPAAPRSMRRPCGPVTTCSPLRHHRDRDGTR